MRNGLRCCVLTCLLLCSAISRAEDFQYVPGPADNPLKGLVPYARPVAGRFPHSMEFGYLPLSDLMLGEDAFDWQPLEKMLNDIASRRHQAVFRIWMEYPGRADGIPGFLEKRGLKVTDWLNTNTAPFPAKRNRTPDYSDPNLRRALQTFIRRLGERYDADPRIGFITAGLLGTWGEWHTYPRSKLMASRTVQAEVMTAYAQAFSKTPILLRYPAGEDDWSFAANHKQPFGYHDDSFAWATLETGRKDDSWFFAPSLKRAGASEKWRQHPIGGEVRPELWAIIFDEKPDHSKAQDFSKCVQETHVSWLMETGMFREQQPDKRRQRAIRLVQQMGYDLHIASSQVICHKDSVRVKIGIANKGVAPFYYDWPVQLGTFDDQGTVVKTYDTQWKLSQVQPGPAQHWQKDLATTSVKNLAIRIVNPLPNGLPCFFANEQRLQLGNGWLKIRDGQPAASSK